MNRYSGGLTVEDLRHAWVLYQQHGGMTSRYLPDKAVSALAEEWHRTKEAASNILGILRRMERGLPPSAGMSSTLYKMTPEERHFVFTGELSARPTVDVATFADISAESTPATTAPAATLEDLFQLLHDASHTTLPEIRDLLHELVSITSRAWGTPDE